MKCVYCYEQKREIKNVNIEEIKQIISDYLNSDKYEEILIEFFGGEPWLKKDVIIEICEWVWAKQWKNKYRFFTSTNGTLIHGSIQDWLHTHNKQISCGLSLDGIPDVHNINRSNSFSKIDIPFFLANWPNQPIKMTITPYSLQSLADNIIYLHSLGFRLAGTNFAEGIDWSNYEYISTLYRQLLQLTEWYLQHPEIYVSPILNMPIENCECWKDKMPNKICAARGIIAYDTDGRAYPCNFITPMTFSQQQLENIKLDDFYEDEKLIDKYCATNCYFYAICPNCYGANLLVNGNLSERDKSMCNLVKLRAYFSAILCSQYILNNKNKIEKLDRNKIPLQIRAIERIKKICEEEFQNVMKLL